MGARENYSEFWNKLLKEWNRRETGYFARSNQCHSEWLSATAFKSQQLGQTGLKYGFIIRKHCAKVQFYICDGKDFKDRNQRRYRYLRSNRGKIEQQFLEKLQWPTKVDKTASITAQVSQYGLDDSQNWNKIRDDMIKGMNKLIRTLEPYVEVMSLLNE